MSWGLSWYIVNGLVDVIYQIYYKAVEAAHAGSIGPLERWGTGQVDR